MQMRKKVDKNMGDSYREILVKRETTMGDKLKKAALIGFTALFFVAGIMITPIFLIAGLVLAVVSYVLIPRMDLEFEYLYVNGELDIDKIMSKQKRKKCGSYDMNLMEIMAPSNSHALDSYKNKQGAKVKDYTSGKPDVPSYMLVFNLDNGQEIIKVDLDEAMVGDIRRIAPRKVQQY